MAYYVYILTNSLSTVLYTGVTNNLERRVYEHKHKLLEGFTSRYNINKLVYFEEGMTSRTPSPAKRRSRAGVDLARLT